MILFVCPSVCLAYITNNSRTQRPSVPEFGRKVPQSHLRCDSHTSSRSDAQRSGLEAGGGIPCRPNPAATLLVLKSLHRKCCKQLVVTFCQSRRDCQAELACVSSRRRLTSWTNYSVIWRTLTSFVVSSDSISVRTKRRSSWTTASRRLVPSSIVSLKLFRYPSKCTAFCRATLCIARPVPSCDVRPPVCASACHVHILCRNK